MRSGCRTTAAPHTDGCGAAIYLLQPGANTRVRSWCPTPGAQYGFLVTHNEFDLDRRLFHGARRRQGGLPPDLPLRLSPRQRRGAVAARDVRRHRQDAAEAGTSSTRTRSRTASTSSACCSTATARTPIGTARSSRSRRPGGSRALPERHRHAGVLRRARRHGVGAGKSRPPASSRPTRWISAAASKSRCRISAR